MTQFFPLPADLPVPTDDGAARHLAGLRLPSIALPSTSGRDVVLASLAGRTIVYAYPRTGVPGQPLLPGWDAIPGARGCTPESCGFRDHHAELLAAGASAVFGLSTQTTEYQREVVDRLELPFEILSDAAFRLTDALRLPTFETSGLRLLKRLTLILLDGRIEHVFYPVFPPDRHAEEVLEWLESHPMIGNAAAAEAEWLPHGRVRRPAVRAPKYPPQNAKRRAARSCRHLPVHCMRRSTTPQIGGLMGTIQFEWGSFASLWQGSGRNHPMAPPMAPPRPAHPESVASRARADARRG